MIIGPVAVVAVMIVPVVIVGPVAVVTVMVVPVVMIAMMIVVGRSGCWHECWG